MLCGVIWYVTCMLSDITVLCPKCCASTSGYLPLVFRVLLGNFSLTPSTSVPPEPCVYHRQALTITEFLLTLCTQPDQEFHEVRNSSFSPAPPGRLGIHMFMGCIICYYIFLCFLRSVGSFNYHLLCYRLDNNQPCPQRVSKGNDEEGPLFLTLAFIGHMFEAYNHCIVCLEDTNVYFDFLI